MTPKEKAIELITRFQHPLSEESDTDCLHIEVAKEFALIAVDEIINTGPLKMIDWGEIISDKPYWQEVKQEIEKL
jgi:hypothetical protein